MVTKLKNNKKENMIDKLKKEIGDYSTSTPFRKNQYVSAWALREKK